MKNQRLYLLLVTLIVGAFVLVACGADAPEPAAPVVEEPAVVEEPEPVEEPEEEMEEEMEEEEVEEEPAVEVTISLTIWADDTRAPILSQLAAAFEAEYGVGLVVEQVADIRDQFRIAAPAGEGPDIIIIPHDQIGELIESGLLAVVDLGAKEASFREEAVAAFFYDGEQYGMPYATENLGFFRNSDLVPDEPATWEEVYEIAVALTEDGSVSEGFILSGTTYDAFPIQTAFGGYIFGRDAEGNYDPSDVGVDSDGMIEAISFIDRLVEEGLMPQSTDWDTAHVLFENGETPFIMAGPWALPRIRESGVPYVISAFPEGPAGRGVPFLGVQGFVVNALSDNVALAQAFLTEFVATDATMQALYDADPRPSAWIPVFEATDDPDLAGFSVAGEGGMPMPAIPEMSAVWSAWDAGVTLVIQQQLDPEDAMEDAGQQIRDLID
jgi:arabinogalactan oligomer / maltooligosaccharide transport system substrate-binding protein